MPGNANPVGASSGQLLVNLDAVIIAVSQDTPRILTVRRENQSAASLPWGPLDLDQHLTLERGVRDWVEQQTGLRLGYVEQLYTFGDRFRDPRELDGGPRVISATYLALVREEQLDPASEASWRGWYAFLPLGRLARRPPDLDRRTADASTVSLGGSRQAASRARQYGVWPARRSLGSRTYLGTL